MNEEKKKKLAQVDELVTKLGLTIDEVVDYFTKLSLVELNKKDLPKINITEIKPGMFWYEDYTFSFNLILGKKVKAIVELVEDGVIYGDLTASETIHERCMTWYSTQIFLRICRYPCKENEKIIQYNINQFRAVYDNYDVIKKAFVKLGRPYREGGYWLTADLDTKYAPVLCFIGGPRWNLSKNERHCVRQVLALKA